MGRLNPSRETKCPGTYGDRGILIFPVQLTTSRTGNLTRLIHTLLYVMTVHSVTACNRHHPSADSCRTVLIPYPTMALHSSSRYLEPHTRRRQRSPRANRRTIATANIGSRGTPGRHCLEPAMRSMSPPTVATVTRAVDTPAQIVAV